MTDNKFCFQSNEFANASEILVNLIRSDTTNPPGNETLCIRYIDSILTQAGFETKIMSKAPGRENLVVRLKGKGNVPPILFYGHADVVTTEHQKWTYPPFEGRIADGCIWGRGALDMKGPLAMMISALLKLKSENIVPNGDIIFAVVSDEEVEGEFGAKYLVEEYPDLFKGVRYAIGEFGGFTLHAGKNRFYPIMVSEKQKCSLKAVIKGPGGHGSIPFKDGAMAKLGLILQKLNTHPFPVHITPAAKLMIDAFAKAFPFPKSLILKSLLNPSLTDRVLKTLGKAEILFNPILHNTVNATIVHGGSKINVIPGEIILEMDGRLLPGLKPQDMIKEVQAIFGDNAEVEVTSYVPGPDTIDMGLFDTLCSLIKRYDTQAIPIPYVISGISDARYFKRIGIQTYGFTPMVLPDGFDISKLIHAADERIPISTLTTGASAMYEIMVKYS